MFNPTKEVPDVGLCKELKRLGFSQKDGCWYWIECEIGGLIKTELVFYKNIWLTPNCYGSDLYFPVGRGGSAVGIKEYAKAPTIRELGEWLPRAVSLPDMIDYYLTIVKVDEKWVVRYERVDSFGQLECFIDSGEGDTEANARAKMLIWLAKNGHVKFGDKEDNKNAKEK